MWKTLKNTEIWQKYPERVILVIGLVAKLLVMPFTAHADLLLTYGRSFRIAFESVSPFSQTQFVPHFLQAGWLNLLAAFTGEGLFTPVFTRLGELTNTQLLQQFIEGNPQANLAIFLMKFLYLIIDGVAVYLLYKFFLKDKPRSVKLLGLGFYWLNPLIIFGVFMFGRYEVMIAALLLALIALFKANKYFWSALIAGVLLATRPSMVLVLPVFILSLPVNWLKRSAYALITLIPFALTFLLKPASQAIAQLEWLSAGQHSDYIFNGIALNDIQTQVLLFWAAFSAFLLWFWQKQFSLPRFASLSAGLAITFALYYATSFYHPQYLVWGIAPLTVFLIEAYNKTPLREWSKVLILIPLALILQLLTWRQDILLGIFLPLNSWLGTRDLSGVINNYFDVIDLSNIGWTAAAVLWGYVAYLIWQYLHKHVEQDE